MAGACSAGAAVPRKLGFTHEVTRRRCSENSEGKVCDAMVWTLFAEELSYTPACAMPVRAFDALGRSLPITAGKGAASTA